MNSLFYYCYYRIAKAYRVLDEKDYCMYGCAVLFSTFSLIILSFLSFIFFLLHKKIDAYLFGIIAVIITTLSAFFINKKKYAELEEVYKNEKHSKLKGWLVFLYIIASVILFFVSINVFDV
jgi:hypothetical protein